MPIKLITNWNTKKINQIIDVRSPSEFKEDHIPGSINLPVLNDKERKLVGTIYKTESPFKAKKLGASLISKNISVLIKKNLLITLVLGNLLYIVGEEDKDQNLLLLPYQK